MDFRKSVVKEHKTHAESQLLRSHLQSECFKMKSVLQGLESMVYPSWHAKENYPNSKWFGQPSPRMSGVWSIIPAKTVVQHLISRWLGEAAGEGNGNPLQCSCLENPRDGGAWWAAIYGVAQSRTLLKWLSSSRGSSKTFGFGRDCCKTFPDKVTSTIFQIFSL